ncbi:MAG: LysM peptidoglycan-binding domain-containing protein [Phycisphaerae bacterium]|nr:LysM peptidoglycan-binding domain-containing protein [Phycisphaerae bacterium]
MTRETKIGLLVGLAFIIVIGILLSDHLTSSTEPPQATLASAGNTVRQAVNTPGGSGVGAPVTVVPPPVQPQQPVSTRDELTTAPPAVQIVRIGGPAQTETTNTQPIKITAATPQKTEMPQVVATDTPAAGNDAPAAVQDDLTKIARDNGQELVSADGGKVKPAPSSKSTYTAQAGDSVSKIVSKCLGSASKANIDAFLKANPSMGGDPTKLLAGKTYNIPGAAADDSTSDAPAVATKTAPAVGDSDDVIKSDSKPAADTIYVYTVKPGDNLTKIARDELGDTHAVASIQELNGDKLKGPHHDIVLVGMKLKLPGKPVATAQ